MRTARYYLFLLENCQPVYHCNWLHDQQGKNIIAIKTGWHATTHVFCAKQRLDQSGSKFIVAISTQSYLDALSHVKHGVNTVRTIYNWSRFNIIIDAWAMAGALNERCALEENNERLAARINPKFWRFNCLFVSQQFYCIGREKETLACLEIKANIFQCLQPWKFAVPE